MILGRRVEQQLVHVILLSSGAGLLDVAGHRQPGPGAPNGASRTKWVVLTGGLATPQIGFPEVPEA
jgi:hypothetical protein